MKLDIILVNLVVVAMVVVPYMLFIKMGWGEAQKLKNKFLQETANHLGKSVEINSWNQIMTGLDKPRQKLVLVQSLTEGYRVEIIDLKHMRSSEIKTEYETVVVNKVPTNILKRIDLEFTSISGEKNYLNLFDHNLTYRQDFELKHAEKLHFSISSCLNSRPLINSAA